MAILRRSNGIYSFYAKKYFLLKKKEKNYFFFRSWSFITIMTRVILFKRFIQIIAFSLFNGIIWVMQLIIDILPVDNFFLFQLEFRSNVTFRVLEMEREGERECEASNGWRKEEKKKTQKFLLAPLVWFHKVLLFFEKFTIKLMIRWNVFILFYQIIKIFDILSNGECDNSVGITSRTGIPYFNSSFSSSWCQKIVYMKLVWDIIFKSYD